jgi:hypothetical protein
MRLFAIVAAGPNEGKISEFAQGHAPDLRMVQRLAGRRSIFRAGVVSPPIEQVADD